MKTWNHSQLQPISKLLQESKLISNFFNTDYLDLECRNRNLSSSYSNTIGFPTQINGWRQRGLNSHHHFKFIYSESSRLFCYDSMQHIFQSDYKIKAPILHDDRRDLKCSTARTKRKPPCVLNLTRTLTRRERNKFKQLKTHATRLPMTSTTGHSKHHSKHVQISCSKDKKASCR